MSQSPSVPAEQVPNGIVRSGPDYNSRTHTNKWCKVCAENIFPPDDHCSLATVHPKALRHLTDEVAYHEWVNEGAVSVVVPHPDNKHVLVGTSWGVVVWNTTKHGHQMLKYQPTYKFDCQVTALALTPDGKHFISASEVYSSPSPSVHLWNLTFDPSEQKDPYHTDGNDYLTYYQYTRPVRYYKGPPGTVYSILMLNDGETFLGGSHRKIYMWHFMAELPFRTFEGHTSSVSTLVMLPPNAEGTELFLSGSHDRRIRLWNTASTSGGVGASVKVYESSDVMNGITCIAVPPKDLWNKHKYFFTTSFDPTIRMWDFDTGEILLKFRDGVHCSILSICTYMIGDELHFATGGRDNTVRLWNAKWMVRFGICGSSHTTHTVHSKPVNAVALCGDGKHIVSGSKDGTVRFCHLC